MQILIDGVEVVTVRKASQMANRTTMTIYNWGNEGLIETKTHNEQLYIVRESLERYLEERKSDD